MEYSNLREITSKYQQELQNCTNQPCRRFLKESFVKQIIMDCRTTPAVHFKTRLGFNQHDSRMTLEQSILIKIKTIFSAEEIIFQHDVLGYRIYAYFPKYKLAIEVDELGHSTRDTGFEIERQKALEKELSCEFIRINQARENFDIFVEIGRIQNHIIKSTRKTLIDEISIKLLKLDFKSNNSIKTKCLKCVVNKIPPKL